MAGCSSSCGSCSSVCIVGDLKLEAQDSNTVDVEIVSGPSPYVVTASVILDPAPPGDDTAGGNLIMEGPNGLYLTCEQIQDCVGAMVSQVFDGLVYDDSGNAMIAAISTDAGNSLTYGSDGGLNVSSPDLVLTTDGTALGVTLSGASDHTADVVLLSTDPNNSLSTGTDGGVYLPDCAAALDTSSLSVCVPGSAATDSLVLDADGCNYTHTAVDGTVQQFANADQHTTVHGNSGFESTGGFLAIGAIPVFTLDTSGIATATITNPSTCRSLLLEAELLESYSVSNLVSDTNFKVQYRSYFDNGSGTLNVQTISFATASVPTGATSGLYSTANTRVMFGAITVAPGATVTLRAQASVESFDATTGGTMAAGIGFRVHGSTI